MAARHRRVGARRDCPRAAGRRAVPRRDPSVHVAVGRHARARVAVPVLRRRREPRRVRLVHRPVARDGAQPRVRAQLVDRPSGHRGGCSRSHRRAHRRARGGRRAALAVHGARRRGLVAHARGPPFDTPTVVVAGPQALIGAHQQTTRLDPVPFIYGFDHKHRKAPMDMKDLLGGKGANLAEMTSVLRLPVPGGFTITTDACRAYMDSGWPKSLDAEVTKHLTALEKKMGRRLGDPVDPLLVSVRSGAKFSMPGMMDTVLNLGLNDDSVEGLAKQTDDERFAYDSYRRFIAMYGRIVLDIDGEHFDRLLDTAKEWDGATTDAEVSSETLRRLCERYKDVVRRETGKPFPQDPIAQLKGAIEAVFRSWNGARAIAYRVRERISHDLGTAVNVQAMVFGNRDNNSGTGVGFTRNAATGENVPYGDFLINAQGEDVVAGIRNTEDLDALARHFPKIHAELLAIFARLESHYCDMCDTEFTIEQGKLWMLQTRVGKRTGAAALRMAVEMVAGTKGRGGWKITKEEAIERITADQLDQVLHPQFAATDMQVIATGLAASPGAAVGRVYFTADDAAHASERGEKVILVRSETSPEDVHGMQVSEGILTAGGGLVSHAAVVARGWGIPAVVGAEAVKINGKQFTAGGITVEEGDTISL